MRRPSLRLSDLLITDAPPIRVSELAELAGLSKTKIRTDARAGLLSFLWVRCGTKRMAVIVRAEAYRYLLNIGLAA